MKKTTDFTMVVMEKREMLDVLQECMELLDRIDNETRLEWRTTGEQEQMTRWNDDIGESAPVYIDEDGNRTFEVTDKPYMTDCYDNLPKLKLEPRDEAKINAIARVRETIASLA